MDTYGNLKILASLFFIDLAFSNILSTRKINESYLSKVSIYSSALSFFSNERHYFLVVHTTNNSKFRLDFSEDFGTTLTNYYEPGCFDKLHRSCLAIPGTTSKSALQVFEKYAKTKKYSEKQHDCKAVSELVFEELSGDTVSNLGEILIKSISKNEEVQRWVEINKGRIYDSIRILLSSGKTPAQLLPDLISGNLNIQNLFQLKFNTNSLSVQPSPFEGYNKSSDFLYKEYRKIFSLSSWSEIIQKFQSKIA